MGRWIVLSLFYFLSVQFVFTNSVSNSIAYCMKAIEKLEIDGQSLRRSTYYDPATSTLVTKIERRIANRWEPQKLSEKHAPGLHCP